MPDTIHAALVAAQAQITNPSKDGKANYGTYATLAGVLDHVRPILATHGLYVAQYVTNDDTHVRVTTSIGHTTGESIDCGDVTWPMPDKVQVFGGLITYLRRYALTAALGLSGADDDDDGAQANTVTRHPMQSGNRSVRAQYVADHPNDDVSGPCSAKQVGMVKRLMAAHNTSEPLLPDLVGITTPVEGLEAMTKTQASALIDALMALPQDKPIVRSKPSAPDPDDPWTAGQFPPDPEAGA